MRRKSTVNDMLGTLMDDLDVLEEKLPAFAAVGAKIREVIGPVVRSAKRLTANEKAGLSTDEIAAGARVAFGRGVRKLREEYGSEKSPKKKAARAVKSKTRRKMGPAE